MTEHNNSLQSYIELVIFINIAQSNHIEFHKLNFVFSLFCYYNYYYKSLITFV